MNTAPLKEIAKRVQAALAAGAVGCLTGILWRGEG